jgi:hypothetical protein
MKYAAKHYYGSVSITHLFEKYISIYPILPLQEKYVSSWKL